MTDRFRNVSAQESCPHCIDGLAIVATRPAKASIVRMHGKLYRRNPTADSQYEEYGPCPWCELGFKLEFPAEQRDRTWKLGYWQGRPPVVHDPPPARPEHLSREENQLRSRLLTRRYELLVAGASEGLPDPCVGLDRSLADGDRLALLREYAKVVGV